jgi:hypothetical protein
MINLSCAPRIVERKIARLYLYRMDALTGDNGSKKNISCKKIILLSRYARSDMSLNGIVV